MQLIEREYCSKLTEVKQILQFVLDYISYYNLRLATKNIEHVKSCILEALNNSIIHGDIEQKKITICVCNNFNELIVKIKGSGLGFNVNEIKEQDYSPEELIFKTGGFGLSIIKLSSDKVVFSDNGREIQIYWKLL